MMLNRRFLRLVCVGGLLAVALLPVRAVEPEKQPGPFDNLKYRLIGPSVGGRVSRACGVPGDPKTYYAACSMGGVWKSTNGGHAWKPIFDDQPVSSIGSLAVAPSDPSVIYVGSGEANIRGNVAAGNGIYRSLDAGKTWKHVWKQEGQIGTLIVHPTNPQVAYAAVLGKVFGPNEQRGIYRTIDGGTSWQRVLYVSPDAGASDVTLDPAAPKVLFAGTWETRRYPWGMTSGGKGSGLYVSRDGGETWTQLVPPPEQETPEASKPAPAGKKYSKGLPKGLWGKVGVQVAPSDGRRVYALIEAEEGGLFRSNDGGDTWERVNQQRALRQRAWYYTHLTVHPKNPDVLWFPQVGLFRTIDGGKSLERVEGPHHGDYHDLWIDPLQPERIICANDGGVDLSRDGGETWFAPPLPIGQFYHIDVDNHVPYRVMGTMQDIGTGRGPSHSLNESGIRLTDWFRVGGGEAGHIVADPSDPEIVYAGEYGGYLSRWDGRSRQTRNISAFPFNPSGYAAQDLKYRFQWTAALALSPHDPKTVYHASDVLFRTRDAGQTWQAISGDLTTNDRSKQQWSGGPITGDNTGAEVYCTIFAVAESPREKGLLWVGSDDGLVHVSRDDGKTWTNLTANIPGLPKFGTVRCLEPSPFDAGTAYLVVDAHRLDDPKPYLYRTTDHGKTWQSLTQDLPSTVYLHVVRCDPTRRDLLYLGTETGVRFSVDGGTSWNELKLQLPTVAVTDLKVKGNDLVLGTNGRDIWILDDLTPIRQRAEWKEKDKEVLLPVQPTVRWHLESKLDEKHFKGFANPPSGAIVHYWLPRGTAEEVSLQIHQGDRLVRTMTSKEKKKPAIEEETESFKPLPTPEPLPRKAGLHRVTWDLRHEGATPIPGAKVDAGFPEMGPLARPGRYTIRLTIGRKTVGEQPLEIVPDPRSQVSTAVASDQLSLTLQVRDSISRLTRLVRAIRLVREQLLQQADLLKDNADAKPLLAEGTALIKRLTALEEKLHNPRAKVMYDILAQKGGAQLYSQLTFVYEQLKEGEGLPTQGICERYAEQRELLEKCDNEWKALLEKELAVLQARATELKLPVLVVPTR